MGTSLYVVAMAILHDIYNLSKEALGKAFGKPLMSNNEVQNLEMRVTHVNDEVETAPNVTSPPPAYSNTKNRAFSVSRTSYKRIMLGWSSNFIMRISLRIRL